MQPTFVVEDCGFRKLMATVDPRYSRRTISREKLPEKCAATKTNMEKDLDTAISVALTTDIWTSCQKKSHCCVTAHLIDDNRELKSYVLETSDFCIDHTAAHISSELQRVTKKNGKFITRLCVWSQIMRAIRLLV